MDCPYCGQPAKLVYGDAIYPHRRDLHDKRFYQCKPCDAYVGCHKNTSKAFGTLANAELRKARSAAHAEFDPIWRLGYLDRVDAYKWLAEQLGLPKDKTHIGMFDLDQCMLVYLLAKEKFQQLQMS